MFFRRVLTVKTSIYQQLLDFADLFSQVSGGAASENRTPDNLITSEVLCQLS